MKLSIRFLLLPVVLLAFDANSANPNFNHKGIQKGAISETCYRNPCSIGKVMSFEIVKKNPQMTSIKLKLVGGSREWDAKKTVWNHDSHNVYVTCSIKKPSVKIGNQVTIVPLNPEWTVPGVLMSDAELYLQTCHNYNGEITEGARKYGYNIRD